METIADNTENNHFTLAHFLLLPMRFALVFVHRIEVA